MQTATIKKLLNKQTSKRVKTDEERKERRAEIDEVRRHTMVRFVSSTRAPSSVSFPDNAAWKLPAPAVPYPSPRLCHVCKLEPRRYVHRLANVPVCSLACYNQVNAV